MPENKSIIFKTLQRARQTILYMKPHCGCNLQLSTIIDNVNCLLTVHGFANNTFGVYGLSIFFFYIHHWPWLVRCLDISGVSSPIHLPTRKVPLSPTCQFRIPQQTAPITIIQCLFLFNNLFFLFILIFAWSPLPAWFPFFYVVPRKYYFYGLQTNI